MQKAEQLETEGKYKDAWTALPKASEYPEFADIISSKQDEYSKHLAPNLFTETTDESMSNAIS